MKKIISLLLIVVFVFAMTCIPYPIIDIDTSAATVALPVGSMTVGVNKSTYENSSGWIKISSAADFASTADGGKFHPDTAGKKYYLANNITIGISGETKATQRKVTDINVPFTFDGCGYTIKTDNSLFKQLEVGTVIKNLVISSVSDADYILTRDNSLDSSTNTHYSNASNGYACGALAWRSYGATITNVVNNAKVVYSCKTQTSDGTTTNIDYHRVGGLVGVALGVGTTPTIFENCRNNGAITGGVADRAGNSSTIGGVGGILGYVHNTNNNGQNYTAALLLNCDNTGTITNKFTSYSNAAGIVGSKHGGGVLLIVNGKNSGTISAKTIGDKVFSQNNTNKYEGNITATAISTAAQFSALSGNGKYYLANNITGVSAQSNATFSGKIYGFYRSVTCSQPPFANMVHLNSSSGSRELTIKVTNWTKITTPEQFLKIDNRQTGDTYTKYYLAANITLPSNYTQPTNFQGYNSARTILLDGCGHTITTNKMIFPELPGGGAGNNNDESTIRNLVVRGNVTVTRAELITYDNGFSLGSVVGKAQGGRFQNITNYATVTYTGFTNSSYTNKNGELIDTDNARVGGIVGSTFNDDITFVNCVNHGAVSGLAYAKEINGVGGILGYAGYESNAVATFTNCTNQGTVTNTSTSTQHAYAGGILGVKQYPVVTVVNMTNCYNNATVAARTGFGKYYAIHTYQNINMVRS